MFIAWAKQIGIFLLSALEERRLAFHLILPILRWCQPRNCIVTYILCRLQKTQVVLILVWLSVKNYLVVSDTVEL